MNTILKGSAVRFIPGVLSEEEFRHSRAHGVGGDKFLEPLDLQVETTLESRSCRAGMSHRRTTSPELLKAVSFVFRPKMLAES